MKCGHCKIDALDETDLMKIFAIQNRYSFIGDISYSCTVYTKQIITRTLKKLLLKNFNILIYKNIHVLKH